MARRIVSGSRYLLVVAVVCIFGGGTALLVYGAVDLFVIVHDLLAATKLDSKLGKQLVLDCIELIDVFLLATVMYVIALGLYALFIDDDLPLPAWLEVHTLDDLKNKLVAVIIVVLGVAFLGQVITWDGQRDLLGFGVAIAAVAGVLIYFLSYKAAKPDKAAGEKADKATP